MKCLSAAEGDAAWHGDCAIFSRWWSASAAPAVRVRGSIPRVGARGMPFYSLCRASGNDAAAIGKQLPLSNLKEHLVIGDFHPRNEVDMSYDSDWQVFKDATRHVGVPLDHVHV